VHFWRVKFEQKLGVKQHRTTSWSGHSLLATVVTGAFQTLGLSAAIWEQDHEWLSLYVEPNITRFEAEHGLELKRGSYNARQRAIALKTKKPVLGEHAGFSDFFVPVVVREEVVALLVTGPFARQRPTAASILESWHWLTGRRGHPTDPEFAEYMAATLSTLVLEGDRVEVLREMLECLAQLMAEEGDAEKIVNRAEVLRGKLVDVRQVEESWRVVERLVDERISRGSQSRINAWALGRLGLSAPPRGVLIGLAVQDRAGVDPVDEAVRRDELQRKSVELARRWSNVLVGRVGVRGVVLLSGEPGGAEHRRPKLTDLAERMAVLARTLGLSLHFGLSTISNARSLSRAYQAALGAAETALDRGERLITADGRTGDQSRSLRQLRDGLAEAVNHSPEILKARYERYLEAVAAASGYAMEPARGHFEAGLERMTEPLRKSGALNAKSFAALHVALDRAAGQARSMADLIASFRRAGIDVADALREPLAAGRDRGLRAAVEYVQSHYGEKLRLEQAARAAGIAPDHFSKLFKRREGMNFEHYVQTVRLEHAKQLLKNTGLSILDIATMTGFGSPQYFCRVFRSVTRTTPLRFRRATIAALTSKMTKREHRSRASNGMQSKRGRR
jgi:AraC-like DNA-binding protein